MHLSTTLGVGIGAAVMVLAVVVLFLRGSSSLDLGAVSEASREAQAMNGRKFV
jgi:hypothetical protein